MPSDRAAAARIARLAARVAAGDLCSEPGCQKARESPVGMCKTHYNRSAGNGWDGYVPDPEQRRASWRAKNHRRRTTTRGGDFTAADETAMRTRTKQCPLCQVKLIDEPKQPASKELDHIIPRGMGGTHSHGNVRILCRTCNLRRPKDGSDYVGPVTLWAVEPGFIPVKRERRKRKRKPRLCECGTEMISGRCHACRPKVVRVARGVPSYVPAVELTDAEKHERAHRAAEMRAEGVSWWDIANALGFGRESSAMLAAMRVADVTRRTSTKIRRSYPDRTKSLPSRALVAASVPQPRVVAAVTPRLCIDCDDVAVRGTRRCSECWAEINDSDTA